MKHYGLLGDQISYSLSPKLHEIIFTACNIEADYRLFDARDKFKETIKKLRASDIDGFNVTIPYKSQIIPFLDSVSERAKTIGSVNTVVVSHGKWHGDNTDAMGFSMAMSLNGVSMRDKRVLIVGAGGAARGIAYALSLSQVRSILVYNRTRERTNQLVIDIRECFKFNHTMSVYDYQGLKVDVVINTTPLGGSRYKDQLSVDLTDLSAKYFVDIIYNPAQTLALQNADQNKIKSLNGLSMLACQAIYAHEVWQKKAFSLEFYKDILHRFSEVAYD